MHALAQLGLSDCFSLREGGVWAQDYVLSSIHPFPLSPSPLFLTALPSWGIPSVFPIACLSEAQAAADSKTSKILATMYGLRTLTGENCKVCTSPGLLFLSLQKAITRPGRYYSAWVYNRHAYRNVILQLELRILIGVDHLVQPLCNMVLEYHDSAP